MGWNEPPKKKPGGNNEPPDLDEALKNLQKKFKKMFGGKKSNSGNDGDSGSPVDHKKLGVFIVFLAFAIWFLSGIFIVRPAEQAVILTFGKYSRTVGPGPHWIPRLISSKVVRNMDRILDYSYSSQMLTKDENLVSVSLAVQHKISSLEDYLFSVTDPLESLHQATSSALRQVIGRTTLDEIITVNREAWGAKVRENLVEILNLYKTGIEVVNVSPQPARAPESVQDAFDDAIKAQEDERRFIEQALAYKAQVVPIARGNAKRLMAAAGAEKEKLIKNAQGEVAEFDVLLGAYKLQPEVMTKRLYFDALQKVFESTSKIIVNSKSANLMYLPLDKLSLNAKAKESTKGTDYSSRAKKLDDFSSKEKVDYMNRVVKRIGRDEGGIR